MDYYIFHAGRGTDGGFGDYSPPYWSSEPVKIGNKTLWVKTESEAEALVNQLNQLAGNAFYSVGNHDTYDGLFPLEYEWRKISVPQAPALGYHEALQYMIEEYSESWSNQGQCYDYDEEDEAWLNENKEDIQEL